MSDVWTTGWPNRLLSLADWEALAPDETHDVECSEGVLMVAPRPLPLHQRAMVRLTGALDHQLPADLCAVADIEVLLPGRPLTVRAPDVLVSRTSVVAANPPRLEADDVLLAVEILSEGSRRRDRVMKMSEYAEAGIDDYWIVDLADGVSLSCYQLADDGDVYREAERHEGTAQLSVRGTSLTIDLEKLIS